MGHIDRGRPTAAEAAEYYFTYINQVPDGAIVDVLTAQQERIGALLTGIPASRAGHRYAPDKWTIAQVAGHINDTERVFAFRALWFGRGFDTELPSFDQNVAVPAAASDQRPWASHLDEFRAVRGATVALFRGMPEEGWSRSGVASGRPVSVRALAYIVAGHAEHHARILRDRYL